MTREEEQEDDESTVGTIYQGNSGSRMTLYPELELYLRHTKPPAPTPAATVKAPKRGNTTADIVTE